MSAFTRALAGAALSSIVMISTTASAADIPSRKAGLWILKSADNPIADQSMCVDDGKRHFVDTDVWSDFDKECKVTSLRKSGSGTVLEADCRMSDGSKVAMTLTYTGDFRKNYGFTSVTRFDVSGEKVSQTITAKATFAGQCPAELKPGMKKMTRTGIIIGK